MKESKFVIYLFLRFLILPKCYQVIQENCTQTLHFQNQGINNSMYIVGFWIHNI